MPPARAPSRTASPRRGWRRRSCGTSFGCGGPRSSRRCRAPARPAWSAGRGQHGDDLGLALGQAGRPLQPRGALPGRLDDRRDRIGVEPSRRSPRGRAPSAARSAGSGVAVGPRLGHRLIGVGRGQDAGRQGELRPRRAAVVAGTVEALVVGSCDRRERRQERRAGEDALGLVGVQPDLLPLIRGQRRRLLPDPRVEPRRVPGRGRGPRARSRRRSVASIRHPAPPPVQALPRRSSGPTGTGRSDRRT